MNRRQFLSQVRLYLNDEQIITENYEHLVALYRLGESAENAARLVKYYARIETEQEQIADFERGVAEGYAASLA
jgi:hypothetical protein